MGIGRGRAARRYVLGVAASMLVMAGCGADDHPNDLRPTLPVEVTAVINDGRLSVQPNSVGFAGEGSDEPLNQNEGQPRPRLETDGPLTVSFTVANETGSDTTLRIRGAVNRESPKILADGTGDFKMDLPTGQYDISAVDVAGAQTTFEIGPARFSPQNDLLLP